MHLNSNRSCEEISAIALKAFWKQYNSLSSHGNLKADQPIWVKRLDCQRSYLLVPIRNNIGMQGVVQLDAESLSVESSAIIRDPNSIFIATEETVLNAAQIGFPNIIDWGKPFLAWRPCRESFDSMRPLWVIPHRNGQVYASQNGNVFQDITFGQGG